MMPEAGAILSLTDHFVRNPNLAGAGVHLERNQRSEAFDASKSYLTESFYMKSLQI